MYYDAIALFKSSLVCSLRVIGNNHIYTADIYNDLANIYMKFNMVDDALNNFLSSLSIYSALEKDRTTTSASICYSIGVLLIE